jgi:phosphoglycerate dehydrogenase-like enzyme
VLYPWNMRMRIAVLDDYQGVALELADWSPLKHRADITVFRDHVAESAGVIARLKPFDIVCVMRERTPLPRTIIDQLPNLKLIVTTAGRNASIDMEAAKERGITVCGTPSTSHGTAELTWALILALVRNLPAESASVRSGGWQVTVGGDLEGRTIGILGFGKIGTRIAKIASAFGMHSLAWSPNLTSEAAERNGARLASKQQLFRDSDIVTLHLVLSSRTKGIVGATELNWMKPTAYLVNTSRGPLVDESALIEALRSRTIAGAALDVYDVEPLPKSHPFRSLENVLATPHVGFVSEAGYRVFYSGVVEDIAAWLGGSPIRVMNK